MPAKSPPRQLGPVGVQWGEFVDPKKRSAVPAGAVRDARMSPLRRRSSLSLCATRSSSSAVLAINLLEWEIAAPQRFGIYAIWFDGYGLGLPPGCGVQPNRNHSLFARTVGLMPGQNGGLGSCWFGRVLTRSEEFVPCRLEALAHSAAWSSWAPLADELLVSTFGLLSNGGLLGSEGLDVVGIGRSAPVALLGRSPCLQFEAAPLVGDQRWTRPEIVALLGEQMPT